MMFQMEDAEELMLLKQSSLCEDVVTKHGEEKNIHIVVKNSPFCLTFGLPSAFHSQPSHEGYNMNHAQSEVKLVYDEDSSKEVDFLKSKPVLFKTSINQQGTKITIEARINVLTSQLEDSLFKVSVRMYDNVTKQVRYEAYSEPIKVISKSDQVKHKRTPRPKRNVTDILSDSLAVFENKQKEQTHQLLAFCDQHRAFVEEMASDFKPNKRLCTRTSKMEDKEQDFTSALGTLLEVFSSLNPEEKKKKLGKLNINNTVDNSGNVVGDIVLELLDSFWSEGISKDLLVELDEMSSNVQNPIAMTGNTTSMPTGMLTPNSMPSHLHNTSSKKDCVCPSCPFKKELARIEAFYEEIFSSV